jgi:hypothetical protein
MKAIDVLKAVFSKLEIQINTSKIQTHQPMGRLGGIRLSWYASPKNPKAGQEDRSLYIAKLPLEESHEEDKRR